MKKIISVLLAVITALSLFSCVSFAENSTVENSNSLSQNGDILYYVEDDGVYFSNGWIRDKANLVVSGKFNDIAISGGKLYASSGNSVKTYSITSGELLEIYKFDSNGIVESFSLVGNSLFALIGGTVYKYNTNTKTIFAMPLKANIQRFWAENNQLKYMIDNRIIYTYGLNDNQTEAVQSNFSSIGSFTPVVCSDSDPLNKSKGKSLTTLQSMFPDGKYWNHAGQASNMPNGCTNTPCNHTKNGSTYCNRYELDSSNCQCAGYAYQCGYLISGVESRNGWKMEEATFSNIDKLKAGDIIRLYEVGDNGHSILITDIVGNNLFFTDCNGHGNCNISWGFCYNINELKEDRAIVNIRKCPVEVSSGASDFCTFKFNANGKNASGMPQDCLVQTNCDFLLNGIKEKPTCSGYSFVGWNTNPNATTAMTSIKVGESDITLYAIWKASSISYTVTFNANGKTLASGYSLPGSRTVSGGTVLDISNYNIIRSTDGAYCSGYSTSKTSSTSEKTVTVNKNMVLYAVWYNSAGDITDDDSDIGDPTPPHQGGDDEEIIDPPVPPHYYDDDERTREFVVSFNTPWSQSSIKSNERLPEPRQYLGFDFLGYKEANNFRSSKLYEAGDIVDTKTDITLKPVYTNTKNMNIFQLIGFLFNIWVLIGYMN